ncbi:MAG: cobyrinate a,c-diamide synthase, partial [Lachnospiraceae bacterium]|nr:cobyrinate a,c-diamide synthase [Lachnospiraceae bacterium]
FARDFEDVPENSPVRDRIAVVEGVMGLYDGLGGFQPQGSSYDIAAALQMPIVLCVNARGAAETLLASISGILSFDKENLIHGIFLNEVSDSFYPILARRIEDYTGIPVLGHLPLNASLHIESRHLGLFMPSDHDSVRGNQLLLEEISKRCDTDRLLNITDMPDIPYKKPRKRLHGLAEIAVARDEAFSFFYRENEMALSDAGANIVYFSPIHDRAIPEGACGLILTGGYPERYADELASNTSMLSSVRDAIKRGIPVMAECGGFMYLHDSIDGKGPLVGALEGDCVNTGKSVRFGYLRAADKGHFFVRDGEEIRGHEFHYYDVKNPGADAIVKRASSGESRYEGFCGNEGFVSFMHFYYPSCPSFVAHFIDEALVYGRKVQKQL